MNFEKAAKKLFTSKYFLYFILFLSVTNLFGYLMMRNLNAIIIFLVVGLLMYNFSKNMAVILLVCLVVTNLLMSRKMFKEGMVGDKSEDSSTEKSVVQPPEKEEEKKSKPATPATPLMTTPLSTEAEIAAQNTLTNSEVAGASEAMTNSKTAHKVDYAATVTEAYKGLNSMLDPEAVKSLTQETMTLMQEQQKLFKSMEAMSPLLSTAKGLLEGMDVNSLKGLADIASSFKGSLKA